LNNKVFDIDDARCNHEVHIKTTYKIHEHVNTCLTFTLQGQVFKQ